MFHALYTHSPAPLSGIIRTVDGGDSSHVGIMIPGGVVWDVTMRHGVRAWNSQSVWLAQHRRYLVDAYTFELPDPFAAVRWLTEREGEGYDIQGALGIALWRDRHRPGKHFCSELLIEFCEQGGMKMPDQRGRVGLRLSRSWLSAMRPID